MERIRTFSSVTTHKVEQSVGSTRVLVEPVGHVQHAALDDNPEVVLLVVLGDFLHRELLLGDLPLGEVGGLGLLLGGSGGISRGSSSSRGVSTRGHGGTAASSASGATPLDGDLAGGCGVDVQRDLAQTVLGGRSTAGDQLLEQVLAGAVTSHTTVDDTAQQGRTTQTVGAVDTTGQLTARVETLEGLVLRVEDLGVFVDLNTTHGEVQDGLHQGDVVVVIHVERHVVEETLAPGVLLLAFSDSVVFIKGLLQLLGATANLLGQFLASHLPHQATASVVTGVEVQDVGSLAVEQETDGPLVLLLLLPHLARDVVTVTQFIGETVTIGVEQKTTLTTEGFGCQELELGLRVLGVDETGRVDLDLVHINAVGTHLHQHLLTITSGVGTVSTRQVEGIWAVLLQEGLVAEVGSITTSGKDNNTLCGLGLAVQVIGDTADEVAIPVNRGNTGSLDNLDPVGFLQADLFQSLHKGVGDGHSGELGIVATMCPGLGVTTECCQYISSRMGYVR